jgi:hypothetical protein
MRLLKITVSLILAFMLIGGIAVQASPYVFEADGIRYEFPNFIGKTEAVYIPNVSPRLALVREYEGIAPTNISEDGSAVFSVILLPNDNARNTGYTITFPDNFGGEKSYFAGGFVNNWSWGDLLNVLLPGEVSPIIERGIPRGMDFIFVSLYFHNEPIPESLDMPMTDANALHYAAHNLLVLTPQTAREYLSVGTFPFGYFCRDELKLVEIDVPVPGLRELILAAGITADAPATSDEVRVTIDGVLQSFEVAPRIIDGRTMLPLRAIGEALGMNVRFATETNTATLTTDDATITHVIHTSQITVNGETSSFDVPSTIIDGRTLVPMRMLAEAIGAEVSWNPDTRTAAVVTR